MSTIQKTASNKIPINRKKTVYVGFQLKKARAFGFMVIKVNWLNSAQHLGKL